MAVEMTEICLLWGNRQIQNWWSCMSKAEWSGWVQAFGAIFAIFASAYIAGRQFVKSESVKEENAARILLQFFGQLHLFYQQWPLIIKNESKCELSYFDSLMNFKCVMEENYALLQSVQLDNLSAEWATCCMFTRANCVQLILDFSRIEREIGSYQRYLHEVEKHLNDDEKEKSKKQYELFLKRISIIEKNISNFHGVFEVQFDIMKKTMNKKSRFTSPRKLKRFFDIQQVEE